MKLLRDDNPREIEKYAHIQSAPTLSPLRCFARYPGTGRSCTLAKDHPGPHVSHWLLKRVMAVWDEGEYNIYRPENRREDESGMSLVEQLRRGPGMTARSVTDAYVRVKAEHPQFSTIQLLGSVLAAWMTARPQFQNMRTDAWMTLIRDPSTNLATLAFVTVGLEENLDLVRLGPEMSDALIQVINEEIVGRTGYMPGGEVAKSMWPLET